MKTYKSFISAFFCSLLFILSFSTPAVSQNIYSGIIKDKTTEEPLPYVNIGIVKKGVGTVSTFEGKFSLELNESYATDTLRISSIGYEAKNIVVKDFKKILQGKSILYLSPEITELDEVVVTNRRLKKKVLGNKTTSKSIVAGFSSNKLGNEVGILVKIKRSPTFIRKFSVSIANNNFDHLKFRLNMYDLEDGLPGKSLLKENIIIESDAQEGVLEIDLEDYNIIARDNFVISLEWIEDLGGKDGLTFSASFFGNDLFVRSVSQDSWEKIGIVSPGMTVTVEY
ncbi:carboxypeptidase-like regulatory domain-containing protein [uncultured Marivirga sp.]|uniref:carboxypeptidase-like regulatory domain-containing protein n=1 Tax=uncultured Marivirga sp. TaxID=1123707 RepID=UPI0030EDBF92